MKRYLCFYVKRFVALLLAFLFVFSPVRYIAFATENDLPSTSENSPVTVEDPDPETPPTTGEDPDPETPPTTGEDPDPETPPTTGENPDPETPPTTGEDPDPEIPPVVEPKPGEGAINGTEVRVRSGPGTNYALLTHNGKTISLKTGFTLIILGENVPSEDPANPNPWCPVSFYYEETLYEGYIYSDFVIITVPPTPGSGTDPDPGNPPDEPDEPDEPVVPDIPDIPDIPEVPEEPAISFEEQLAKFPPSYQTSLRILHELHPNWRFEVFETGLDWSVVQYNENKLGRSLTDSKYLSHYSTAAGSYDWYSDTYYPLEAGRWYQAAPELVAYYMDPRNFLTENAIFMFELLAFSPASQTEEAIETMLKGTFMEGKTTPAPNGAPITYAKAFMVSAYLAGVSPFHLVTRCIQEVGWNGTHASAGTYPGYEGYYNFFSIGANTGMESGLAHAKSQGWDSPYKAILAGGQFISGSYLEVGQNTPYFQKYSVVDPSKYYWHQYMTNVAAPYSEGVLQLNKYKEMGYLDSAFVFRIPVYINMPTEPCPLPAPAGSSNNLLQNLVVEGQSLTPTFDFYSGVTDFSLILEGKFSSIQVVATPASRTAVVTGSVGNVPLVVGENKLTIICTSATGVSKEYTITVLLKEAPEITDPETPPETGEDPDPETPNNPDEKKAVITGNQVQVRVGPGTNYERLFHNGTTILLYNGSNIVVKGESFPGEDGNLLPWYFVSFAYEEVNYEGYVRSDFVSILDEPILEEEADLSFEISSSEIRAEKEFTASISISSENIFGRVTFQLEFDPDLLEYISGADSCNGNVLFFDKSFEEGTATAKFEVVFRAKEAGEASLVLSESKVFSFESENEMNLNISDDQMKIHIDPAFAGTVDIDLQSSSTNVIVGQNVTVTIHLNGTAPIGAGQWKLHFDPNHLEYVSGADSCEDGILTFLQVWDSGAEDIEIEIVFLAKVEGNTIVSISDLSFICYESEIIMENNVLTEDLIFTLEPIPSGWEHNYTLQNGYISGIAVGTTVPEFLENLGLFGLATAQLMDPSGTVISNGTIKTGLILSYFDGKNTTMFHIILYGDANGDGKIDAVDLLVIRKYLLDDHVLLNEYFQAADLNRDNKVDAVDLLLVRKYLLQSYDIIQ